MEGQQPNYYNKKAKIAYQLYKQNKPFVKVYAVVQKGEKYLVLKNTNESAKYKYFLAGGGVENEEDIQTAAKREIAEELNVDAKFIKELGLLRYIRTWIYKEKPFDVDYEAHVVLCEYVSQLPEAKIGLKGEFNDKISVEEISKEEMIKNVAEFASIKF